MSGRDICDLHAVRHEHIAIHKRLADWARYVTPGRGGHRNTHPMWIKTPAPEGWTYDELPIPLNLHECGEMEKAVRNLPHKHGDVIRWCYVYGWRPVALWRVKARFVDPSHMQRYLAVTRTGLADLIHDARSMLKNRSNT